MEYLQWWWSDFPILNFFWNFSDTALWIVSGEKPFSCDHCDMNFMYKKSLKQHLRSHRDLIADYEEEVIVHKIYECDECDEKFHRRDNFKWHKLKHAGHVPFQCDQCGKEFFRKDHLVRHKRMHSGLLFCVFFIWIILNSSDHRRKTFRMRDMRNAFLSKGNSPGNAFNTCISMITIQR